MHDANDLVIPALGALASAKDGWMTLPDLSAHLETRLGSTAEEAGDARSPESMTFRQRVLDLIAAQGADSLVARGYAATDETGARVRITDAGRAFIGRG